MLDTLPDDARDAILAAYAGVPAKAEGRGVMADVDPGYLDNFQRRVLRDALNEATADYWRRRAEVFAAVGTESCDQVALACQRHAALLAGDEIQVALGDETPTPWELLLDGAGRIPTCPNTCPRGCLLPVEYHAEDIGIDCRPSNAEIKVA